MTWKSQDFGFIIAVLLCLAPALRSQVLHSQVKVTVEHNTGSAATRDFKFKTVPSPVKDDAGAGARLKLVVGEQDASGAPLSALTDGVLPADEDDPGRNFFFSAGSDGGRFLLDFGRAIEIAQVNTYSWHSDSRAPQVYNLFASDGAGPGFNVSPDSKTDPATCGWKLIATVDTRPAQGEVGGQYGVSITDASGPLGKFRYLLFDTVPTESDDPWGNTFYSEVDVVGRK
ncbi:MAG TPA: hypothetical protein VNW97_23265 [Candidatus Saccharimonadales bacterium]|nr:hypothetical protein [Candidatus Saccharimonadales bacterium]